MVICVNYFGYLFGSWVNAVVHLFQGREVYPFCYSPHPPLAAKPLTEYDNSTT